MKFISALLASIFWTLWLIAAMIGFLSPFIAVYLIAHFTIKYW